MVSVNNSSQEAHSELIALGSRLRRARLARNESMAQFAARIDVSIPTLRAAEQGLPTVGIGTWIAALWALDRLDDLADVLADGRGESIIDRAIAERRARPPRQRAPRQPR